MPSSSSKAFSKHPNPTRSKQKYCFTTLQNREKESQHPTIQTRLIRKVRELEKFEIINLQDETESRAQFLSIQNWIHSTSQPDAKQAVERRLVEFQDIFTRHRFDNGVNPTFKVKLTPLGDNLAYSHSQPALFNLKYDVCMELALLHK